MGKIDDMIAAIDGLVGSNFMQAAFVDTCERCEETMLDDVRDNLMHGKGSNDILGAPDVDLQPTYDSDPYFKGDVDRAHRYKRWKEYNFDVTAPPSDSPNLFINGTFHNSLYGKIEGDAFEIDSSVNYGQDVINKYGRARFYMSQSYYTTVFKPTLNDTIINSIRAIL